MPTNVPTHWYPSKYLLLPTQSRLLMCWYNTSVVPGLTLQNPIDLDQGEASAALAPPQNPEQIVLMSDSSSKSAAAALPVPNPEEIMLMSSSSEDAAMGMPPAGPIPNPEEILLDADE